MTQRSGPQTTETDVVRLQDGRTATLRLLGPDDGPALLAAIEAADPGDLRRRFMGCPPPASFLVRRLEATDAAHHVALGAFDGSTLVGVAQFDRTDDRPVAEIAVAIATEWQHSGLGTSLVLRLADIARGHGIHHFTARFFADNLGIRGLLSDLDLGNRIWFAEGEGFADVDLDDPVAGSAVRR